MFEINIFYLNATIFGGICGTWADNSRGADIGGLRTKKRRGRGSGGLGRWVGKEERTQHNERLLYVGLDGREGALYGN